MTTEDRARRAAGAVIGGMLVAVVLTGCGGGQEPAPAGGTADAPTSTAASDDPHVQCDQIYQQDLGLEGKVPAAPGSFTRQAGAAKAACDKAVDAGLSPKDALRAANEAAADEGSRK